MSCSNDYEFSIGDEYDYSKVNYEFCRQVRCLCQGELKLVVQLKLGEAPKRFFTRDQHFDRIFEIDEDITCEFAGIIAFIVPVDDFAYIVTMQKLHGVGCEAIHVQVSTKGQMCEDATALLGDEAKPQNAIRTMYKRITG